MTKSEFPVAVEVLVGTGLGGQLANRQEEEKQEKFARVGHARSVEERIQSPANLLVVLIFGNV
jgi:hypothetical protein